MKDIILEVVYMNINELTLFYNNSKINTKEQITHIKNSIQAFGFNDPIGISGKENIVLEGNGRVEALKSLGYEKVPCIRLDHLSAEEQQAYVIAHNSTNLETGLDDGILYQELKQLQKYDFSDFGIDIDKYLKTLVRVQQRILKPLKKVHYLISMDINLNDKVAELICALKRIDGVEIESTIN